MAKKKVPTRIPRSGAPSSTSAAALMVAEAPVEVERSPPPPPVAVVKREETETGKGRRRQDEKVTHHHHHSSNRNNNEEEEEEDPLLFASPTPNTRPPLQEQQQQEEEELDSLQIESTQDFMTRRQGPAIMPTTNIAAGAASLPGMTAARPPGTTTTTTNSRQRPRFHTVQDLDLALHQAIEGKINIKNAWESQEASKLLEGITHTIEQTLEAHQSDDYGGFAKVATVVEGCSKVWTSRVDSTYKRSNQMVQRLLRNEDSKKSGGAAHAEEEEEDNENENEVEGDTQEDPSDPLSSAAAAARRRKLQQQQQQQRKLAAARTVALDATEINLDAKSKHALTQSGINAQFRSITEKFDQSHANGLLLTNAPLGRAGNLILDVDYTAPSEQHKEFSIRRARRRRLLAEELAAAAAEEEEAEAYRRAVSRRDDLPAPPPPQDSHGTSQAEEEAQEEAALLSLNPHPPQQQQPASSSSAPVLGTVRGDQHGEDSSAEVDDPLGALARGMRLSAGGGHGRRGSAHHHHHQEEEDRDGDHGTRGHPPQEKGGPSGTAASGDEQDEEEQEDPAQLLRARTAMFSSTARSTTATSSSGSGNNNNNNNNNNNHKNNTEEEEEESHEQGNLEELTDVVHPLPAVWQDALLRSLGLSASSITSHTPLPQLLRGSSRLSLGADDPRRSSHLHTATTEAAAPAGMDGVDSAEVETGRTTLPSTGSSHLLPQEYWLLLRRGASSSSHHHRHQPQRVGDDGGGKSIGGGVDPPPDGPEDEEEIHAEAAATADLLLLDHHTIMHGAPKPLGVYPSYLRGLARSAAGMMTSRTTEVEDRHPSRLASSTLPPTRFSAVAGPMLSPAEGNPIVKDDQEITTTTAIITTTNNNDEYEEEDGMGFNDYDDDNHSGVEMEHEAGSTHAHEEEGPQQQQHNGYPALSTTSSPRGSGGAVRTSENGEEALAPQQQQQQRAVLEEAKRLVSGIDEVPLDEDENPSYLWDEEHYPRESVYSLRSNRSGVAGGAEGEEGVALGLEDASNAWCLLQDLPDDRAGGFAATSQHSELAKLHRAARFLGPNTAGGGVKIEQNAESEEKKTIPENHPTTPLSSPPSSTPTSSATRKRGQKTVTFDIPSITSQLESIAAAAAAAAGGGKGNAASSPTSSTTSSTSSVPLFNAVSPLTSGGVVQSLLALATQPALVAASALKQSPTLRKNLTPLGKELLLDKNAAANTLAYTQTAFQRSKAMEHKLLRPAPFAHVPPPLSALHEPAPSASERTGSANLTTMGNNNNNNNNLANPSGSCTPLPSYLPLPPVSIHAFFQPFSTSNPEWNVLRKSAVHLGLGGPSTTTTANDGPVAVGSNGNAHSLSGALLDEADDYGQLPTERIPVGAEMLHLDGHHPNHSGGLEEDDSYYNDGGYGDLDNDGAFMQDDEEEDAELERRRAELNLLAQLQANAAAAAASRMRDSIGVNELGSDGDDDAGGGRSSWDLLWDEMERLAVGEPPASPAAVDGEIPDGTAAVARSTGDAAGLLDSSMVAKETEWMKALRAAQPTLLQSVDVSKLRQLMWEAIKDVTQWKDNVVVEEQQERDNKDDDRQSRHVGLLHGTTVMTGTGSRKRARTDGEEEGGPLLSSRVLAHTPPPPPASASSLLKASARQLYASSSVSSSSALLPTTRRHEAEHPDHREHLEEEHDEAEEKEEEEEKDSSDDENNKNKEEEEAFHNVLRLRLPYLSHVVARLLPHVRRISPSGVLSPAFLFFSLLFIANEHNVLLENEELEKFADLKILSIAPRVEGEGEDEDEDEDDGEDDGTRDGTRRKKKYHKGKLGNAKRRRTAE